MAFSCPICGDKTTVNETRTSHSGLRRRRYCVKSSCTGRLTTFEIVARGRDVDAEMVLVPKRKLEALHVLASQLAVEPGGEG